MNRQQIKAWTVIGILLIVCFSTIIFFSDIPLFGSGKKKTWGAIAIRDNVNAFQKTGTALFTRNYLRRYASSYYYTQDRAEEHRGAFVSKLNELLRTCDSVDIFLLAHTNRYYEWVEEIDPLLRKKIHLVYNTGCSGFDQWETWKQLGVSHYVCHKSNVSISPVFYFYFLRRYFKSRSLREAITQSNIAMHLHLARIRKISLGSLAVPSRVEKESEGELCSNR